MTKDCDIEKNIDNKKILSKLQEKGVRSLKNLFLIQIAHLNQVQSATQSSKTSEQTI